MNWYLTKLVFRIICGAGEHTAQFDEQLRLVMAEDKFHAFHKAQRMGHQEQDAFFNCKEKLVQWKFIDVCEIHTLHELTDGAEIYSRIKEEEDADIYTRIIRLRAKQLFEETMQQCFQHN